MSLVIRRYYLKASKDVINFSKYGSQRISCITHFWLRSYGSDYSDKHAEFTNSTILVEDGLNVRELPVVVRKIRNLTQNLSPEPVASVKDGNKYHLIQAEFRQCTDLRDIFSLLSKCIKITPNIALGAMERIGDLENSPLPPEVDSRYINANLAKGAILDKLLKVVMQTEDTHTLLNALNVVSSILDPYKYKFCDELLIRVIDNKLSLQELSDFMTFLAKNRKDEKYEETIDKLWVGFVEKQEDINEKNIVSLFNVACNFKISKPTVMFLLEKKLWSFWWKMNAHDIQEILSIFIQESNLSMQSLSVVGRWLNTSIHVLNDDSLLDIITKLTRLQYTDIQIENAIERYVKLKSAKIESQVLILGILNYCITFRIRNVNILNGCGKYFVSESKSISHSFLKSFIYPFGYLFYDPENSEQFWKTVEKLLYEKFSKVSCDDVLTILLSGIYLGKYPLKLIDMIFETQFLAKLKKCDNADMLLRKLSLIDASLSFECKTYSGPYISKDQWSKAVPQDLRINKIAKEIQNTVQCIVDEDYKVSISVSIPHLCPNETYIIDLLLHPNSLSSDKFDWITNIDKNKIIAILVHLPEHYCYNSKKIIGQQMMRKKHLRLLGMRVLSLNYTLLCKLEPNKEYLEKYIRNLLENSEVFL